MPSSSVQDLPTGPKQAHSTVLSAEEEAVVVAFRRHTLLPLDDCLYALRATIPHLTPSSLHRCLQRHGLSRLPEIESAALGARHMGRSGSTISRELRRNAATRGGELDDRAITAQWHAEPSARRPKAAKLVLNAMLRT